MRRSLRCLGMALVLAMSAGLVADRAEALDAGPDDLYSRVVDVGAGLCVITAIPNGHYLVYDAGHWNGSKCVEGVRDVVEGEQIDVMILSHGDADHLGDVPEILEEYNVRRIIRTGYPRWDSGTWRAANEAIAAEALYGTSVHNLQSAELIPGTSIDLGSASLTLVAGWPEWTASGPTASERRNAISIVARLDFNNRSILFTGDTVGRRKTDNDAACKDAEKVMVDRASQVPIKSDVITAPHHGGNNGNAKCFIEQVDPEFVIFSAGNKHDHPTSSAAQRYIDHGVSLTKMFRTDRGDDEGGSEWPHGSVAGCADGRGDDDIDVVIRADGTIEVDYRNASTGC